VTEVAQPGVDVPVIWSCPLQDLMRRTHLRKGWELVGGHLFEMAPEVWNSGNNHRRWVPRNPEILRIWSILSPIFRQDLQDYRITPPWSARFLPASPRQVSVTSAQ